MELVKQDIGVWVKASDELPDFKFMRSIEVRHIKTKEKFTTKFDPLNRSFGNCLIEELEWLKPIKEVYVLTEDDLEDLIVKVYRHSTMQGFTLEGFIQSITTKK